MTNRQPEGVMRDKRPAALLAPEDQNKLSIHSRPYSNWTKSPPVWPGGSRRKGHYMKPDFPKPRVFPFQTLKNLKMFTLPIFGCAKNQERGVKLSLHIIILERVPIRD